MIAPALDLGGSFLAWETSPALVCIVLGPEAVLAFQNARSRTLVGPRPLGTPIAEAFPEAYSSGGGLERLERVRTTGQTVHLPRTPAGVRDVDGGSLVLHYVAAPYGDGPPHPGVILTAIDITSEVRAERAAGRARLLAQVAEGITKATGPDEALQFLTDTLVPAVADVAAVFVTDPRRPPAPAPAAAEPSPTPPAAMTINSELLLKVGPPPAQQGRERGAPWDEAISAGRTVLIDLRHRQDREAVTPQSRSWLGEADVSTIAVLPLVVAGELAGAVVLAAAGDRTPYADEDVPFFEDLAARAGAAVSHLRSVRRQWQVALDLQRVLLPAARPQLPGVHVASRYVAGSTEVDIGGDWWDIADLGAGRVGIGVGDVSGRGVLAAAVMGQARAAMRAAAHADLSPSDVLTLLDSQLTDLVEPLPLDQETVTPPRFATSVYAVLEPFDQTLRIASAGHPPVLVRSPQGEVMTVNAPPGPPLGLGIGPFEEVVVPFRAGSVLAAFTDGLVESRELDIDTGIARLARELGRVDPGEDLDEAAQRLLTVVGVTGGQDDVALVLLRVTDAAVPTSRVEQTLVGLGDISPTRRAVGRMAAQFAPDREDEVVQVTSELLANGLEHGRPPVRLRAHTTAHRLVVSVTDTSALAPRPTVAQAEDERGRGLAIVAALADAWGVRLSRLGKMTWAEFRNDASRGRRPGGLPRGPGQGSGLA